MERRLSKYGYEPVWAKTLADAMKELDNALCCVVLDLALPDGSGVEVLRCIREKHLPIKVAVVTGREENDILSDAMLLKPDAFFRKPIDAIELVSWLHRICPQGD